MPAEPTPLPLTDAEIAGWLTLLETPGVGAATARQLLATFGLPTEILAQSPAALAKVVPLQIATALRRAPDEALAALIAHTTDWARQPGNHLLTLADPLYPQELLALADPPPLLYAKGQLALLRRDKLAIVGSRDATEQGVRDARQFAQALARQPLTIVSGLAQGIDAAAHEGALAAGADAGSTIAVVGTGLDIVYPAANRGLAHQIAEAGLLLSEFPLGCGALPHQFPQRNRLIAALALGTVVVEAAQRSGALVTARLAGELGREVFALPGSIHSPLSKGCHQLIRQGAKLVESAQHIVEELRLSSR